MSAVETAADLSEFAELGKVPWEQRAQKVKDRFPTVADFDWREALDRDIDLFGRLLRDILKLEQAAPGRPGPRPSLDVNAATRRLQQLFGNDFTIQPFSEAFRVLSGGRSVRHLASKIGLPKDTIHRLMTGRSEPDGYHMQVIAEAFGKHPSYFLEWRILYVVQAITRRLEWSPETSVDLYQLLDGQRRSN